MSDDISETAEPSVVARCHRCGKPATTELLWAIGHAGTPSCERCIVEVQYDHARDRAIALAGLEARLQALGGPATVLCGYALYTVDDDFPLGEFCELPEGHEGRHAASPNPSPTTTPESV